MPLRRRLRLSLLRRSLGKLRLESRELRDVHARNVLSSSMGSTLDVVDSRPFALSEFSLRQRRVVNLGGS